MKKVFGTIPHQRLTCKLASCGIISDVYKWIDNFLSNGNQRVRVGKDWSTKADKWSGILQEYCAGTDTVYNFY